MGAGRRNDRTEGNPAARSADAECEGLAFDEARVRRVKEGMLPDAIITDAAETFRVLANPTRLRLIRSMAEGELCVCDLAKVVELSISATSHQLQLLRQVRIVQCRTEGKMVYYRIRDPFILELLDACARHVTNELPEGTNPSAKGISHED